MKNVWYQPGKLDSFYRISSSFTSSSRISGLTCKILSDEVQALLSVCCEGQVICIWSSWCHCHPIVSCFIKIQVGLIFLVPAYRGCPGNGAVKHVSVCLADSWGFPHCLTHLAAFLVARLAAWCSSSSGVVTSVSELLYPCYFYFTFTYFVVPLPTLFALAALLYTNWWWVCC